MSTNNVVLEHSHSFPYYLLLPAGSGTEPEMFALQHFPGKACSPLLCSILGPAMGIGATRLFPLVCVTKTTSWGCLKPQKWIPPEVKVPVGPCSLWGLLVSVLPGLFELLGAADTPCGKLCVLAQSCLSLCDPTDCSPLGSSVHGIFQARILEWVAIFFSRGSPRATDHSQALLRLLH